MTRSRDVADSQDNLGGAVAPFVAGKNFQINGGFDIWQRGTTINNASHNTYTADQWVVVTDSIGTVNLTQQNISAQGLNSTYAMRVEKSAGASNRVVMISVPEGALNCVGKTVTVSGYLRKGAGLTSNVGIDIGTRVTRFGTQYDAAPNTVISNASLNTSTFTKFSISFNVTTATSTNNANLFELEIYYTQAGGANVFLEIAAIQIEVGSVATPFSRAGGSIGGELALCQRYFTKSYELTTAPASVTTVGSIVFPNGVTTVHTGYYFSVPFKQTMRAAPTVVVYSYNGNQNTVTEIGTGNDKSASSAVPNSNYLSQTGFGLNNVSGVSISFTNGGIIQYTASAEL